jgi:hypothetical protein
MHGYGDIASEICILGYHLLAPSVEETGYFTYFIRFLKKLFSNKHALIFKEYISTRIDLLGSIAIHA